MFLKGYEVLAARHREDGGPPLYVTTIVSDNEPARRLLERGLRGVPTYRALDELVTLSLTLARARAPAPPPGVTLHPARPEDLDAIVACLARAGRRRRVATRWSREDLLDPERTRGLAIEDFHLARRRDAVVGCLARWDQRAYKQVVIRGYSRRLAMLRPVANLLGPVLRLPHLPPVGAVLDTLYLSHVAVDEDDPAVLLALVGDAAVQARDHGFGHATLGLSGRGGLARAVQAAFPAQEYRSQVYLVHWEDGAAAAAAIEPGPTHLEVAVL